MFPTAIDFNHGDACAMAAIHDLEPDWGVQSQSVLTTWQDWFVTTVRDVE